jgi:effector-binding domain-containing protein
MTRLIEVLISLAIVTALFLVISLALPSSRHLSEKVETNRKLTIVYDTLDSVRRFDDWNPLLLRDPQMKVKLSGPPSGVGARLDYSSENAAIGSGSWEIVANDPGKSVTYAITNNQRGRDKRATFVLRPTGHAGRNIEITENYDVTYGWDLMGRYAGLYVAGHVGDDMKMGLERLANLLTSVPNDDYRMQGSNWVNFRTEDVPAEHLLVVNAGSIARDPDKLAAAMKSDIEWIKRSMESSGLVAAGPMRIISTELGRENYTFDIAQPVRKAGSGDKKNDEAKDVKTVEADKKGEEQKQDGELVFTVDTLAPVTAAGQPLEVKIPDGAPVEYVQTKPGHVAMAYYTGFMAELDNVRNALRAWALTQGYEVTDRPYEIYKNGIDQAFTAEGEYEVYWTLK